MGGVESERVQESPTTGRRKAQFVVLALLIVTFLLFLGSIAANADLRTKVLLFLLFGIVLIIALAAFLQIFEHTYISGTPEVGKYHVGDSESIEG